MTPVPSRILAVLAALVLTLGLVAGCSGSESDSNKPAAQADSTSSGAGAQPAPAVQNGTESDKYPLLDLAAFHAMIEESKGKAVLVCVWSVNCPACQQELPVLEQLADTVPYEDLRVVYASLDDNPAMIDQFFGDYIPVAEVVRVGSEVAVETGAEYIPRLVIYDRDGKVSFKDSGFYPQAMLEALVQQALGNAQ